MPHDILRDPINWLLGGLTGLLSVLAAVAMDPTGGVAAVLATILDSVGTLFTVTSIFGFTVAPNLPSLAPYTPILQGAAVVFAVLWGVVLLDSVYENLKRRVNGGNS